MATGCGGKESEGFLGRDCPPGSVRVEGQCEAEPIIQVNTVGYLPERVKRATIPVAAAAFAVHDVDGNVAYEGEVTGPVLNQDTEAEVWIADFSDLTQPGEYYLVADSGLESPRFTVGEGAYDSLYEVLMLGMYGQRCGVEVELSWAGERFHHGACHVEDASLDFVGHAGEIRDGTHGWHDAGDYGKYTLNGAFANGLMLLAWEHFAEHLVARTFLPRPETGLPDYLAEVKFNLDWLMKMQNPDGSVAHKLTPVDFAGFVTPESDHLKRYYSDWGSAATADFVASMAQAARVYAAFDEALAADYLAAAERSYDFLLENPDKWPNFDSFLHSQYNTGSIDDDICWASCEMWETTGSDAALAACEDCVELPVSPNWDWDKIRNLAIFTYALSTREDRERRDPEVLATVVDNIKASADDLAASAESSPYGLAYSWSRYWGINGIYARTVVNLQVAHLIDPDPRYLDAATQQIDHLLGRNYYGRSQVTGIGYAPPMAPHHRPSAADKVGAPWPGLLIGGSNLSQEQRDLPNPPPPGAAWTDNIASVHTNEVAINWNAALIYAVAGFLR